MKARHLALLALGATLAVGPAIAQQPVTQKPAQIFGTNDMAKAIGVQATVVAIDLRTGS